MVFPTNAPDPTVPHIYPDILQFPGHSRAAIAAQAQARLFLDVGRNDHIRALPAAGRAAAEGPQATRADVHDLTQPPGWERPAMFFDKPEPHGVGHSLGPMAFMPSITREKLGGFF